MIREYLLVAALMVGMPAASARSALESNAWYDLGHRVVVRVAELRLNPHTVAAVRDILAGEDLTAASLWADQVRGERRETAPLHFVNIPLEADAYLPERDCPGGRCIIAEIERDRKALADPATDPILRAEALRFLLHFVGDLHQPLHVTDNNNDKGGNLRQVTLLGTQYNLHQVWDGELIEATGITESEYFARLRKEMDSLDLSAMESGSVVGWAMEGHRLAREYAYQLPKSGALGSAYMERNLPIVDLALIKAGVRLAKVLNDALAHYNPAPLAATALGPRAYTDREAAAHVGEVATVVGTVVSVHRSQAGNIYLNFGADYPHQTFSGAILNPGREFQGVDSLAGKRVGVNGLIKRYKGHAEILIEGMGQIVVSE